MLGRLKYTQVSQQIPTEKPKRYKIPGNDQILAEMIQARGKTLHSGMYKLVSYIWN
jgi:hypothetical protein